MVRRAIGLFAFLALVALFTSAPHAQDQRGHPNDHGGPSSAETWAKGDLFASALLAAMVKMHEDMMRPAPSGDSDRDFLATMIPHHEGAVEMARLVLLHGRDPLVRALAEEIIAAQQSEIAAMKARLSILEKGADPYPGGFPALGSLRGEASKDKR